jgi:hypothetical protein
MTTFIETFTGIEDRERVLTEILRLGPAAPGTTLIAHVDRATLEVLTVRSIPTPDPIMDADSCFAAELIQRLNAILRGVAEESVPQRTWTGRGWSAMTGELITVVCREGEAAITPVETQYWWGWRYSNHGTTAFHGDVYAVTPHGWVSMLGEWSAALPALPDSVVPLHAVSEFLHTAPEVQDAERILADASSALMQPGSRECLLCYVHRMTLEFGCNTELRFAHHYRDVRAPRATGLDGRLGRVGGYCDCEIFLNGYDLRPEYWLPEETSEQGGIIYCTERTWPDPLPGCTGVRAGSTQPCSLWYRRRRW